MVEAGFEPRRTDSGVHVIKYYIMVAGVEKEEGEEAVWGTGRWGDNGQIS